ncbi:ABC-type transporter, integral membrane subunit [Clostridium sp. DL-VIII]|uniref:ABC transporter permease n=1 Tax=Clostridium sp. DL-VIII TaxID=641107 RepID=UPI00023B0269|nr:ABC transporter permease subunit [Clostridium sp. DL-VIII]EHJ01197.1 ABC-type transporter, integral membrane subunit [Clostridium sp. DL-VIII]
MFKKNYEDIIFKIIIGIFVIILSVLILFTIWSVLKRSAPYILESLMDTEIQFSIKTTLYTSTVATCISLLFSIPIAYGLAKYNFFGKGVISGIIQIPNSIPPIASGIALLLLFSNEKISVFLNKIHLDPVFSTKGIILAHFFINAPYMIRIIRTAFEEINPKLEFISRTLGYGNFGTFFKVSIPMARNGLITAIIITWTNTLGEFGTALMLAGSIRMKTETLPVAVFLNLSGGNLDKALAAATILIIISIIGLFSFEFISKKDSLY